MNRSPTDDLDVAPPGAELVDDDLARRGWEYPAAILVAAALLTALLYVGLRVFHGAGQKSKEEALVESKEAAFRPDDPGRRGYAAPKLIGKIVPKFPSAVSGSLIKGVVRVGLVVSAGGTVTHAEVVVPLEPVLDAIALRTARELRFEPASRDGKPSEARIIVAVPFEPF